MELLLTWVLLKAIIKMANQKETLNRLNKERDYEDRLADNLLNYYIVSLEKISDLNEKQKKEIERVLSIIAHDSQGHSSLFNVLINYVLNNGETEY